MAVTEQRNPRLPRRFAVLAAVAAVAAMALVAAEPSAATTTLAFTNLDSEAIAGGVPLIEDGKLAGFPIRDIAAVGTDGNLRNIQGQDTGLFLNNPTAVGGTPVDVATGPVRFLDTDEMAVALAGTPGTVKVFDGLVPSLISTATMNAGETIDAVAIGDVNGDNEGDLIAFGGSTIRVFLNDGVDPNPGFASSFTATITCTQGHAVASGDFNEDGKDDVVIVCGNGTTHRIQFYLSTGSALTAAGSSTFTSEATPTSGVEVGDVDGDGHLDALYWTQNIVRLSTGVGNAFFQNQTLKNSTSGVSSAAISDLDHDGDLDIAILLPSGGGMAVRPLLNNGNTQMSAGPDIAVSATAGAIAAFRMTKDQAPELIVARSGGIDALRSAPVAETTPGAIGDVTVGQTGPSVPIVVTNRGAGRLNVGATAITGANAADFAKTGDTCSNNSFDTGESCIVSVSYSPAAAGASVAALGITADTVDPVSVALTGTGVAPNSGPQGPAGPAGADGAGGADGAQGATGPQGPAGSQGARGSQGATGATGPAGRDAVVTCKVRKTKKTRRVRVRCTVKLAARARVTLRRAGHVVARGVVRDDGRVVLRGRRVPRGVYTLVAGAVRLEVRVR